jgi:hypothetical protein
MDVVLNNDASQGHKTVAIYLYNCQLFYRPSGSEEYRYEGQSLELPEVALRIGGWLWVDPQEVPPGDYKLKTS